MAGLVLTFRLGQRAFLMTSDGSEIEVEFVRHGTDAIRMRFIAPLDVKIERESVRFKKNAQQEESAKIDIGSATRKI